MLQNKETTVQSYQKMTNQSTKKNPGITFAPFNCTREMGMDNFGYLKSSFCFISFCSDPAKKAYGVSRLMAHS